MTHSCRRWASHVLLLGLVLLLAPGLPVTPVAADQIADKRAEARRLTDQIEQQADQVAVLAEEYNQARLAVDEAHAKVDQARRAAEQATASMATVRDRLRTQAVAVYMRGGSSLNIEALARNSSVDGVAVQQAYLRSVTAQARDALDAYRAARARAGEQQAEATAATRVAATAAGAVEARRNAAARAVAAQQATLRRVTGELSALVAAEQQRRAEEDARRARARQAAADAARARAAPAPPKSAPPGTVPGANAPAPNSGAAAAVAEARKQIGKPYQWGGSGPDSFDCSGLTMWSWRAGGRSLPHSAQAQYNVTTHISMADLAPGDLLFFGKSTSSIHHMGMYVGDGQMIEASQTGTPVRYRSISRSDLVGLGRVN